VRGVVRSLVLEGVWSCVAGFDMFLDWDGLGWDEGNRGFGVGGWVGF